MRAQKTTGTARKAMPFTSRAVPTLQKTSAIRAMSCIAWWAKCRRIIPAHMETAPLTVGWEAKRSMGRQDRQQDDQAEDVLDETPEEEPAEAKGRDEQGSPSRRADVVGEAPRRDGQAEERACDDNLARPRDRNEKGERVAEEREELVTVPQVEKVERGGGEVRVSPVTQQADAGLVQRQVGHGRVPRHEDRQCEERASDPGGQEGRPVWRGRGGRRHLLLTKRRGRQAHTCRPPIVAPR